MELVCKSSKENVNEISLFDNSNADGDDNFFFKSDHLALKKNPEYVRLMKVLAILEFKRIEFANSLDVLQDLLKLCQETPNIFFAKLFSGEVDVPSYRDYKLPNGRIDWSKLGLKEDENGEIQPLKNMFYPQTRNKLIRESQTSECEVPEDENLLVRGRKFDETKPETFNQLWTDEEQARLEELLVEYPPERIENRRWTKIAKALGNRSPRQVCSRVQKYFLKLYKAGLSVPGRAPRSYASRKKGKLKKNLHHRTTFFPKLHLETPVNSSTCVKMETKICMDVGTRVKNYDVHNKNEWIGNRNNGYKIVERSVSETDNSKILRGIVVKGEPGTTVEIPDGLVTFHSVSSELTSASSSLCKTSERLKNNYIEMKTNSDVFTWLDDKKKYEILCKIKESESSHLSSYRHFEAMCHQCEEKPLVGQKWVCSVCSINLCSDCIVLMIDGEQIRNHPLTHPFISSGILDDDLHDYDYYPEKFKSSNHLDPNFKIV